MSEPDKTNEKDEDPLIRQWRAARKQSGGTSSNSGDKSQHEAKTAMVDPLAAEGETRADDELQALAEDLLSGPKSRLGRIPEVGLDAIAEQPPAKPTSTPEPHPAPPPKSETAEAVAAAVAGAQATSQTHIPETNEIEEARNLMRARVDKRRRKSVMLFCATVLVPLAAVLLYLSLLAHPLYETRAVIAISQPEQDGQSGGSGVLGALGGGPGMAQSFKADEYIRSPALEHDLTSPDWAQRLAKADIPVSYVLNPIRGAKMVDSSIDVQAGVMTVYTRMPDPAKAVTLSNIVLDLVSQHVDKLTSELGNQRLSVTRKSVDEARSEMNDARRALVKLQILAGDVDPAQRIAATYAQIAEIETQIYDLRAQIDRSEVSGNNDSYEIQRKHELIGKLQKQAEQARQSLVDSGDGGTSPNELLMEFELATQNVSIAEETLSSALSAWSRAQVEVALERSVMQIVVPALSPRNPTYPRFLVSLFITAVIGMAAFFTLRMILMEPE